MLLLYGWEKWDPAVFDSVPRSPSQGVEPGLNSRSADSSPGSSPPYYIFSLYTFLTIFSITKEYYKMEKRKEKEVRLEWHDRQLQVDSQWYIWELVRPGRDDIAGPFAVEENRKEALSGASGLIMPSPWEELRKPTPPHLLAHVCLTHVWRGPSGTFCSIAWGRSVELSQETLGRSLTLPWEVFRTSLYWRENQTKYNLPGKCNNLFSYFVFSDSWCNLSWGLSGFGLVPIPLFCPERHARNELDEGTKALKYLRTLVCWTREGNFGL